MIPLTALDGIRDCIRELLSDHVSQPFLNLREADLQARLWTLLRERLDPSTITATIAVAQRSIHCHSGTLCTGRVHLEMKVGNSKRSDIVVLRADRSPRLKCATTGPTDVVALLDPEDVEAVIEIKAAPSHIDDQCEKFAKDVEKLDRLRQRHPHLSLHFVLVDKSVSVPGAYSEKSLRTDGWTSRLPPHMQVLIQKPKEGTFIEVWDLDDQTPPSARLRFVIPGGAAEVDGQKDSYLL